MPVILLESNYVNYTAMKMFQKCGLQPRPVTSNTSFKRVEQTQLVHIVTANASCSFQIICICCNMTNTELLIFLKQFSGPKYPQK